ncbi:hypothetical protein [Clostridium senegalense]|uniref:hypothetical protein n=1 Tax=Clostridium senegalense TaxID=1465809 RepID=UPI000289DBF6|nr:hypothetical protein [Clostridium senegalense]
MSISIKKREYGESALSDIYSCIDADVYMDFTFYPSINEWNGNRSIQIIINSVR